MGPVFPLISHAQSSSVSVCVWERVVAGSPACADVLGLSTLVATDGKDVVCVTWCVEARGFPARHI